MTVPANPPAFAEGDPVYFYSGPSASSYRLTGQIVKILPPNDAGPRYSVRCATGETLPVEQRILHRGAPLQDGEDA